MSIKLKLSSKDTPFSFQVTASDLKQAIERAMSVTGASSVSEDEKSHIIAAHKDKLYVIGMSPETFALVQVKNSSASGSGKFAFDPTMLFGVTKGRNALDFQYEKGKLKFKAVKTKFQGVVDTTEVGSDQLPLIDMRLKIDDKSGSVLENSVLEQVRAGIAIVALKDVYNDGILNCYIKVEKKRLSVSSFDNHHLALFSSDVKTKAKFKLAIPASTFNLIDRFIQDGDAATFNVTSKSLTVFGSGFIVHLPPLQADDGDFDMASTYVNSLGKPNVEFTFNSDCMTAVNNTLALASSEPRFYMNFDQKKNDRISIGLQGDHGSVSDSVKVDNMKRDKKSPAGVKIDPRLFSDLMQKADYKAGVSMNMYVPADRDSTGCFMVREAGDTSELVLIGTYYD